MSVIYRPHKGSLEKAMAEAREFDNLADMINTICDEWNDYYKRCGASFEAFKPPDIVLETVHEDERIGWKDAMYVCSWQLDGHRYKTPQCIGFCATDYDKGGIKK